MALNGQAYRTHNTHIHWTPVKEVFKSENSPMTIKSFNVQCWFSFPCNIALHACPLFYSLGITWMPHDISSLDELASSAISCLTMHHKPWCGLRKKKKRGDGRVCHLLIFGRFFSFFLLFFFHFFKNYDPFSFFYLHPCNVLNSSPMEEFATKVASLAQKLAEILAEKLGHNNKSNFFQENCLHSTCYLRLNRYPPCPIPVEMFGLMPHTDSDFLTILHQDQVGGLQLVKDGKWIAVKPNPEALIINIGDLFQVICFWYI